MQQSKRKPEPLAHPPLRKLHYAGSLQHRRFEDPPFLPESRLLRAERLDMVKHRQIKRLAKVFTRDGAGTTVRSGKVSFRSARGTFVDREKNRERMPLKEGSLLFECQSFAWIQVEDRQFDLLFQRQNPFPTKFKWPVMVLQPSEPYPVDQVLGLLQGQIFQPMDLSIFKLRRKRFRTQVPQDALTSLKELPNACVQTVSLVWLVGTREYFFYAVNKLIPFRLSLIRNILAAAKDINEVLQAQLKPLVQTHLHFWSLTQARPIQDCQLKNLPLRLVTCNGRWGVVIRVQSEPDGEGFVHILLLKEDQVEVMRYTRPSTRVIVGLNLPKISNQGLIWVEVYREKLKGLLDQGQFIEHVLLRHFLQAWPLSNQAQPFFSQLLEYLCFSPTTSRIKIQNSLCNGCYQRVLNLQTTTCPFCRRLFHSRCTEQNDKLWLCSYCKSCPACFKRLVKQPSFKCFDCHRDFHESCCVSIAGSRVKLCCFCSKCQKCSRNIFPKQGETNGILCTFCYRQVKDKVLCAICQTDNKGEGLSWLKCQKCNRWLHHRCDPLLQHLQAQHGYCCPECRIRTVRSYVKEAIMWLCSLDQSQSLTRRKQNQHLDVSCFEDLAKLAEAGKYDSDPLGTLLGDLSKMANGLIWERAPCDPAVHQAKKLLALLPTISNFMSMFLPIEEGQVIESTLMPLTEFKAQGKGLVSMAAKELLNGIFSLGYSRCSLRIPGAEGLSHKHESLKTEDVVVGIISKSRSLKVVFKKECKSSSSQSLVAGDLFSKRSVKVAQSFSNTLSELFQPQCRKCRSVDVRRCKVCLEHFCLEDTCVHLQQSKEDAPTLEKNYEHLALHVRRRLLHFEEMHISFFIIQKILQLFGSNSSQTTVRLYKSFQGFFNSSLFQNYVSLKQRMDELKSNMIRLNLLNDVKNCLLVSLKYSFQKTNFYEMGLLSQLPLFDARGFLLNRKNVVESLIVKPEVPKQISLLCPPPDFKLPEQPTNDLFEQFSRIEICVIRKIRKVKELYERMRALQEQPVTLRCKRFGSVIMIEHQDIAHQDGQILLVKNLALCNSIVVRIVRTGKDFHVAVVPFLQFPINKQRMQLTHMASLRDFTTLLAEHDPMVYEGISVGQYFNLDLFTFVQKVTVPNLLPKPVFSAIIKDNPFDRRLHCAKTVPKAPSSLRRLIPPYLADSVQKQVNVSQPKLASKQIGFSFQQIERKVFQPLQSLLNKFDMNFYRQFKAKKPPVFIGPSKIHRLGLFAQNQIKRGSEIIQYIGERIREPVAQMRIQQDENFGGYILPIELHSGKAQEKLFIDSTYFGNQARFINHSCEPNCALRPLELSDGTTVLMVVAFKDIECLEELTYDYKRQFGGTGCQCGSKLCKDLV